MLVALFGQFADHREIVRGVGEIDHYLVMAVFEHVVEGRPPPGLTGLAGAGRAVFEDVGLVALAVVPAETASLEDRMQGVDEDDRPRQRHARGPAALAETAQQVVFRQARQTLADQPTHQAQTGCQFHRLDYAGQLVREEGLLVA
ncbi:hypothetical protein ABIF25_006287 [Bradyrhizobium elkanii]